MTFVPRGDVVTNNINFIKLILSRYIIITPIWGTRKPLKAFTRFTYYLSHYNTIQYSLFNEADVITQ